MSGKLGPVKPVNHTSWMPIVTQTDRPKLVCNRCLTFCSVVCVVALPFWHFCWCRGLFHRTESDVLLCLLKIWRQFIRRYVSYNEIPPWISWHIYFFNVSFQLFNWIYTQSMHIGDNWWTVTRCTVYSHMHIQHLSKYLNAGTLRHSTKHDVLKIPRNVKWRHYYDAILLSLSPAHCRNWK